MQKLLEGCPEYGGMGGTCDVAEAAFPEEDFVVRGLGYRLKPPEGGRRLASCMLSHHGFCRTEDADIRTKYEEVKRTLHSICTNEKVGDLLLRARAILDPKAFSDNQEQLDCLATNLG